MLHKIPVAELEPQAENMAHAIESCVHCGFCLPTCPTYIVMGEEMDSPRGRIYLMKEMLEGGLTLDEGLPFIDNCVGCLACQTVCPAGVKYAELITPFRARAEEQRDRPLHERLRRRSLLETVTHPGRFRAAAWAGVATRPLRRLVPPQMRPMVDLLPRRIPKARPLPELHPAEGLRRARVALLAGCAQQVLAPEIGWATLRVLARNGVETVVPPDQGCCGALAMHAGVNDVAKPQIRNNLRAFPTDVDAIISNAAGCGSGMKEYALVLKGEADEQEAREFADRVMDVSVFLEKVGARAPGPLPSPMRVAYHDACHLAHPLKARMPPRRLLNAIPNLELLEPDEWEVCCGSAGTYNIEKPDVAAQLGARKVGNLLGTGGDAVATGNIGCLTQIRAHLGKLGRDDVPVFHTMQILERAYRNGG